MLEPTAIPALMKAVDFLFQEGSKILQERRERRAMQAQPTKAELSIAKTPETKNKHSKSYLPTEHKVILNKMVDEKKWFSVEREVNHQLELLEIFSKNYYLAKEQYSKWGSALVPPVIVHNLTEAEDGVSTTLLKLRGFLAEIYNEEINIPELDILVINGK